MCQGSSDFLSGCLVFTTEMPFTPELSVDTGVKTLGPGVCSLDRGFVPSRRTRFSTVLSKFPLKLFKISEFLLLSLKPISRRDASFMSKLLSTLVIFMPKTWLGLLVFCGLGRSVDFSLPVHAGDRGGVKRSGLDLWKVELALLRLKPNLLPGLGGRGGGSSFQLLALVLPVFCRTAGLDAPDASAFCSYFCRMNFSIATSTSSASMGMSGRTPFGFHTALLLALPTLFMFST